MSIITQFFQGGVHFTDPRWLPKGYFESSDLGMSNGAASFDFFSTANGWTYLSSLGTAVDTDYAADTWKTLLSVSTQAGYMSGVVGPTMATATDTTTFGVAVDGGAEITVAVVGAGTVPRCFLGFPIPRTLYTTADESGQGFFMASDKSRIGPGTVSTDPILMPVQRGLLQGVGMIRFTNSLVVRCKTTQAQTATAAQERQSGVIWQRMY